MAPRNPEPTRAAIIAAASRLLESGGIEAVTLRAVGDAAGISRAAPYRHFADKAALLQHLAVLTLGGMAARMRDVAEGLDAIAGLQARALAYVHAAVEQPNHYLLIFGDMPVVSPAPEAEAAADDAMRAIEEGVEQARDRGYLSNIATREMATVIWVALHGISQLQITGHLHEPRTLDGDARLDELVSLAIGALGVVR